MKKALAYILFLSGLTFTAFAQKDKEAKTILNELSKKYRSYSSIKTDFTFTLDNKQAGITHTQTGTLISKTKGNKFRVSLYDPLSKTKSKIDQEIMSDGKTQWTYMVEEKEVQVNDAGVGNDGFNPAQIFTIYEKGYKYLYTGTQKQGGKIYQVIDLTPEAEKAQFFKIRLMIDKAKKQIYNVLVFDRNGSRYTYTLKMVTPNVPVADAYFVFDPKKYPGVEVVDLR
ncbi:outer membrane lipoprotein carrier protein LolA [Mucilaginibacter limnophilus]|uniref:Outer membrane lipoprotein carrier protein LolA n=1 Tax=Mucilaginibacter limnophilus TaxID=1932778 RepID=A0A437MFZ5_9SPHI|nr:outer membrane lipoprotein carrier protein LolA [Mucilaginibacter limnophilus]RVT96571.1 outer membrane lipoprotein carrier protein LolA [Mucilaginibacter limnophilus]